MPLITFLGAARTVTGSKSLVEVRDRRILVDCGLFQGLRELRRRNWGPLPVAADAVDAVVLTHAHVDHSGYLPRLFAQGFRGRIFCTPATADLCRIVLPDAGRLAEEDARSANFEGYTRHSPAEPLFTEADAIRVLASLQPVGYDRPVPVTSGVEVTFVNSGHLLGSAFAVLSIDGAKRRTMVFSGDVGRYGRPILPDPKPIAEADTLVVETTYGDRSHPRDNDGEELASIVRDTVEKRGKVIIPAFAIGRVEELIYWLKKLEEAGRIPLVPVYLDSPMALEALEDYARHSQDLDPEMRTRRGEISAFLTRRFRRIATRQESIDVASSNLPSIVISSSGMATGGRVLNHLKVGLPNPRNTVLFSGFQAEGTRGRRLVDGEKVIKMHGQMIPVAARIAQLESLSAHADANELMRWLGEFQRPPATTCLVHGEPESMEAFRARIVETLHWDVHIPEYLEQLELG